MSDFTNSLLGDWSTTQLIGGMLFSAIVFSGATTFQLWYSAANAQRRVVLLDPPQHTAVPLWYEGFEQDTEAQAVVERRKELDVFYLALTHLDGWCSVAALWKVINKEHNDAIRGWDELQHRVISQQTMREILDQREWGKDGQRVVVLPVATAVGQEPIYKPFVLMRVPSASGGQARRLVAIADMMEAYVPTLKPEARPELAATLKESEEVELAPLNTRFNGVLVTGVASA